MKNILITGGAGFIGSNFVYYVLDKISGIRRPEVENVIVLDNLNYAGFPSNLSEARYNPRFTFCFGSITDQEFVRRIFLQFRIDTVVNFAAETHVDHSIANPRKFIETNVNGTLNLLMAAREFWLDKQFVGGSRSKNLFLHISTDEVFGTLQKDQSDWTEATCYNPNTPYSASKAAADQIVMAFSRTYGLPVIISRCSNNYGEYQLPEKFIPRMVYFALSKKPLTLHGSGEHIRDWIYTKDHCDALWRMLKKGESGLDTYNLGGGNQLNNRNILSKVISYLNIEVEVINIPDRQNNDLHYAMDYEKATTELGWMPSTPIDIGLQQTVEWYLRNQGWLFMTANALGL